MTRVLLTAALVALAGCATTRQLAPCRTAACNEIDWQIEVTHSLGAASNFKLTLNGTTVIEKTLIFSFQLPAEETALHEGKKVKLRIAQGFREANLIEVLMMEGPQVAGYDVLVYVNDELAAQFWFPLPWWAG
jgi:hypothetical protein